MFQTSNNRSFLLEVNEGSLKLWQYTPSPRPEIALLFCELLETGNDAALKGHLKEVASSFKLSKQNVGVVLPRSSFTLRILDLPVAERGELEKMISLQIGQLLPYEPSDIISDFLVNQTASKPGNVQVVLFAILKNALNRYLGFLKEESLVPQFISPPTPFLLATYGAKIPEKSGLTACIERDSGSSELVILEGHNILQSRVLKQKELESHLQDEIATSMDRLRNLTAETGFQHIFTNDRELYESQKEALAETFQGATIHSSVGEDVTKEVSFVGAQKMRQGSSLSVGFGFGLESGKSPVKLLPEDLHKLTEKRRTSGEIQRTGLYAATLIFCLFLFVGADSFLKNGFLQKIDTQVKEARQEVQQARKTIKGAKLITEASTYKKLPLVILHEVYEKIPSGIYLTFFEYSLIEGIKIRGMAKDVSQVSDLLLVFQKSEHFQNAEIKFAKKRIERKQEFTDFQINCLLKERNDL